MKRKVVPKLRQEVKVKVDIVTSDDTKIYYTGKFQDFTARYIIITHNAKSILNTKLLIEPLSLTSRQFKDIEKVWLMSACTG